MTCSNAPKRFWEVLGPFGTIREVNKKEVLLQEGEISERLFYVKSGCLRSWYNDDGRDISMQFFFPDQSVASFESMKLEQPSQYTIEAMQPSVIYEVHKDHFFRAIEESDELKDYFINNLCMRFIHYQKLFLSRIKDTPEQRYHALVKEYPELIKTIPQHYIASYLGITSVSLSRIRCRK